MDECMLNDLLECSVCLERLDTSSKVLPCQHTFCKKCLEEIVSTKKELRCPECRVLVECKVGELPPNVLLMRILEGMRNAGPKKRTAVPNRVGLQTVGSTLSAHPVLQPQSVQLLHSAAVSPPEITRAHCAPKQTILPNQPCARAIYDYLSNEQGDLKFKKGDIIYLRKKMDVNWYHGEFGGKQGVFPLSYVQVITPLPSHIPQCKALYDFRMTNDDEEGCLTFNKGEVINVIRRVDENWAEGKLTDRIGIFPLAFVELNNVARALMKLSSNSQPGPSRLAPPTPTSEDTTPLIPTDHSRTVSTAQAHTASHHHITMGVSQDSSSTLSSSSSSSTTPNTPSSNTSSSSSTAPSSPASPPPRPSQPPQNTSSPPPRPAYNPTLSPPRVVQNTVSPPHGTQAGQSAQNRGKRHSFSSVLHTGQHQPTSHRHSAEILTPSEPLPLDGPAAEQSPQSLGGEVRHRRSGSSDMAGCPPPGPHQGPYQNAQLPAPYIALYPYKPQKADEMELRKGGIYMVTERCQDGWFKGTSNRTQKGGVFPGNYVAPTKQVSGGGQLRAGLARPSTSPSCSLQSSPRSNGTSPRSNGTSPDFAQGAGFQRTRQQTGSPAYSPRQQSSQPPELPPRSSSPQVSPSVNNTHHASPISTSWHGQPQEAAAQTPVPLGRSQSAVMPTGTSQNSVLVTASVTPPPNVAISARSTEKVKERKEKSGVSLMRRLTSIKKSKSPPPLTSYSMDNPVFEDGSVSLTPSHPVHVRASETSASGAVSVNQHRKSNSLDAGSGDSARKASKPAAPPVRERFRCIVPYPPNSEYELELRVGDIIYVHKKRDDGWYKGTQQRTGRTGLFPASFVETF